jgi:hypothetical protein
MVEQGHKKVANFKQQCWRVGWVPIQSIPSSLPKSMWLNQGTQVWCQCRRTKGGVEWTTGLIGWWSGWRRIWLDRYPTYSPTLLLKISDLFMPLLHHLYPVMRRFYTPLVTLVEYHSTLHHAPGIPWVRVNHWNRKLPGFLPLLKIQIIIISMSMRMKSSIHLITSVMKTYLMMSSCSPLNLRHLTKLL